MLKSIRTHASHNTELEDRTVGVVLRVEDKVQEGYVLFSVGHETYLVDQDGCVVHEWRSTRVVFTAKLLPGGSLLRDGNELMNAPLFNTGGAAGHIEVVTWENEVCASDVRRRLAVIPFCV